MFVIVGEDEVGAGGDPDDDAGAVQVLIALGGGQGVDAGDVRRPDPDAGGKLDEGGVHLCYGVEGEGCSGRYTVFLRVFVIEMGRDF